MEFMLFLCAVLSALGGAITGARAPGVAVRIERAAGTAEVAAPRTARAVAAAVMAQAFVPCARLAVAQSPGFALYASIPLFAQRRRE